MAKANESSLSLKKKNGESNLTKTAYHVIKNNIMLNNIKTGECLSACQLAKTLNMSRTPVREALNILENEGFVEIHNGRGFFVREVTEKDLAELVAVRTALECSALESKTLQLDMAVLDKLLYNWNQLKIRLNGGQAPELNELVSLDYETHDFLVTSSHNAYLIDLIKNISMRFKQMQYLSVVALNDALDTVEQHIALLDVVKAGDLEKAVSLLKVHIRGVEIYMAHWASSRIPRP